VPTEREQLALTVLVDKDGAGMRKPTEGDGDDIDTFNLNKQEGMTNRL